MSKAIIILALVAVFAAVASAQYLAGYAAYPAAYSTYGAAWPGYAVASPGIAAAPIATAGYPYSAAYLLKKSTIGLGHGSNNILYAMLPFVTPINTLCAQKRRSNQRF